MRNMVMAAAFAGFVIIPAVAAAQDPAARAAGGAAAGAVTGGVVGGPPGAAVGAAVGATVGAASQTRPRDRVIVEERALSVSQKTCVEDVNRKDCVETRR
jgi:YMGG-like Gly-zipper